MNKSILFAMLSVLILTSCSKIATLENTPRLPSEAEEAIAYFEKKYDVKIDPNQDWNSTVSGQVKIPKNKAIEVERVSEAEAYTMCFEDHPQTADYDMNDIVLRTTRLSEDKIQLSIIACGAHDALVLGGIQGTEEKSFNGKEVHELFGYQYGQKVFINTEKNAAYKEPVTEIVTVEKNLRMDDFLKSIYIENRTTGQTIKMPQKGEAPHAIIVPTSFRYPLDKKSLTDAYPDLLTWAVNMNKNKFWYLYWIDELVYPNKFSDQ